MKKIKFLILGIILIGITSFTSCKKEGCTDPDSTTYNADAKKDDGTCQYEGRTVFWYGKSTSDSLYYNGSNALTFYVDNNVVGSTNTTIYWTGAPNCGANSSITVTKDLGGVKTQSFSYKVKDDLGFEIWAGYINFNANTCIATELTW